MATNIRLAAAALAVLFLSATAAHAIDPVVKCESGKLKESSKYASCRLKADSKGVKKGIAADYTKCETKFADKWSKIETKAGPTVCPSEGDVGTMDARITTDAAEIATLLAGGSVPVCGDDLAEGNESCDGTDLGGSDCTSLGFASGTLGCTSGCGLDVSACVSNPPPSGGCGNGILEAGELCEFGELDGETCSTQGFFGSGLSCVPLSCTFDPSACDSCSTAGGFSVGGSCWFLGDSGDSCDDVCGGACYGLNVDYDAATLTYAGSSGTDANCKAVLDALSVSGTTVNGTLSIGIGLGCSTNGGDRYRFLDATTSSAKADGSFRACACAPAGP